MNLGACNLIRKIAEGGIADIYLAKAKTSLGKEKYLVCKCIKKCLSQDNEFLNSIIHEVQFSVQLRHPNILEIFDLCAVEDQTFLTMEYLDALDFHKLLRKNCEDECSVPYDLAIYAICQAANGLNAAHELTDSRGNPVNLVHRDISPENILFGSNGDIKISDFGIAKTSNMPDITPPDTIKGKFNYMSPEHAWGDKLDRRADLFALAVILYEAVTGKSFYPTDSVAAAMQCARMACYVPPHKIIPDFPEDLEKVLAKALDLDKNQRYPTVLEFRFALDKCVENHQWNVTKDQWIAYISDRLGVQKCQLPLMHAGEMMVDATSIMKPESIDTEIEDDPDATGQIMPDALAEILNNTAKFRSGDSIIRASSEALRKSGMFYNSVPSIDDPLPEYCEDFSATVQCPAPDLEMMEQLAGPITVKDEKTIEPPAPKVDADTEFKEEKVSSEEMLVTHSLNELPKTSRTRQSRFFFLALLVILIVIVVLLRIIIKF